MHEDKLWHAAIWYKLLAYAACAWTVQPPIISDITGLHKHHATMYITHTHTHTHTHTQQTRHDIPFRLCLGFGDFLCHMTFKNRHVISKTREEKRNGRRKDDWWALIGMFGVRLLECLVQLLEGGPKLYFAALLSQGQWYVCLRGQIHGNMLVPYVRMPAVQ